MLIYLCDIFEESILKARTNKKLIYKNINLDLINKLTNNL